MIEVVADVQRRRRREAGFVGELSETATEELESVMVMRAEAKEVGVVAVAVLEDLEDEGLGEVEVGVGMGSVGSVPSASVVASLWVLKMLKIRLKMRVLVYFRARFGNFDFGF
ncbi:hypothetical protein LWI29_027197 [Acer saccharum]|uniref:Uncharacterized protein n=1 Tax=Acer saccharum TaxID=4024 RepID=A0AA39VYC3_ACESA|nr:hypothetical protein LWI29_027197 [Acer saccharum]